ncbi:MAG: DUF2845 domain-containing protein [Candidatus Manganitrophaceae bacterium]
MRFLSVQSAFRLGGALFLLLLIGRVGTLLACDAPAVSISQTKEEVKAKCGAPIWVEKRKGDLAAEKHPLEKHRSSRSVEEWYYNLGPQQFIRILQFKNGRLAAIETGGYGWTADSSSDFGCERAVLPSGAPKVEVRVRCGKPTSIQKKKGRYETWFYDLGPSRFVRMYEFQNGRLANIKTGEYGR